MVFLPLYHNLKDFLLLGGLVVDSSSEPLVLGSGLGLESSDSSVSLRCSTDNVFKGTTSGMGVPSAATHVIPHFPQTSMVASK